MTLLVALCNSSFSVLVGDRRLTLAGRAFDEESTKLCVLCCHDARVSIAFTGCARLGETSTQDWLRDTVVAIGQTTHTISEILVRLASAATDAFAAEPRERLTILVSGFSCWDSPEPFVAVISNFDASPESLPERVFRSRILSTTGGTLLAAFGSASEFLRSHSRGLEQLLSNPGVSADAVSRAAILRIQRMVRQARGAGPIGMQCNSAIVPAAPNSIINTTYHSAFETRIAYTADVVFAAPNHQLCVCGSEVFAARVVAGPSIRKKDPCWCGNGRLFRDCHMKFLGAVRVDVDGFRAPLAFIVRSSGDIAGPSGSAFIVTTGMT